LPRHEERVERAGFEVALACRRRLSHLDVDVGRDARETREQRRQDEPGAAR
jgi:hypothetical protein